VLAWVDALTHSGKNMRRWLARLSFSFFLIACVLLWEAHKASAASDRTRSTLYTVGAVVALGLGAAGVRERHRPG
jgi:hypothetical protein